MLAIIQLNTLKIENQTIETDTQKIQVLGLLDMNSIIIRSRNQLKWRFLSGNYKEVYMNITEIKIQPPILKNPTDEFHSKLDKQQN